MCGFFITNSNNVYEEDEDILDATLSFRGPDGSSGIIVSGEWKSYHSRLSIIDLTPGTNQPVINEDGSQLVFNGEILNYKELGIKYFNKIYESDTFLLNDLIRNRNLDLIELDGFFSFVFINSFGKLEYACRDRFGVKPLYYIEENGCISFSSEPSTLKELFKTPINQAAIDEYKCFRAPIFEESYYLKIHSVQPGCCYVKGKYFDLTLELLKEKKPITENSLIDALKMGVKSRCVSDAPIGLLLSRGIDSNLIRYMHSFDRYYSVGFSGDDDIEYLKRSNIEGLTVLDIKPEDFKKAFDFLLNLRKEPLSVPNEVLLYLVAKYARGQGIKVLLSGEGADEFFAGYDRIFTWAMNTEKFDVNQFVKLYAYNSSEMNEDVFQKVNSIFLSCGIKDPFEMVRWFFIKYHMPILFRRLDFSLMAAGVEGREPIANMHLFDLCKNLTSNDLMISGLGKKPLRDLLASYMGEEFSFSKKIGFPVQVNKIFDNPEGLESYDLWFKKNLEVLL